MNPITQFHAVAPRTPGMVFIAGAITRVLLLIAVIAGAGTAGAQTSPPLDPTVTASLKAYITTHYQSPEEYILSQFKDHDVVFLGEYHRIKHDPELVQTLIPLLHRSGVYSLGFEFARREEQALIDSVLRAPEYHEDLARLIIFKNFVFWGYKEYVDIFKAAWALNRSLPPTARPFRILGLNNSPDWSVVKSPEDRDTYEVMSRVWHGETEEDWARVLIDVVIAKGEKALVYCGIHHAFTEYRQPIARNGTFIRFGDIRAGNVVFRRIGKRAITIYLHAPWISTQGYDRPSVRSADGYVDAVLEELDAAHQRFGVDLRGTPFGALPGETSLYKFGYEKFTLETIYDGYVCQGPLSGNRGVTPIRDFINAKNLEEARSQSPNPQLRGFSAEELNAAVAHDADIPKRFLGLR